MSVPPSPGHRAILISLSLNAGLAVVKLVCGIIGHSYALVADSIESLGDVFGSAIVRTGLVIASRPADANHPYGHGKAEPLAVLMVAGMLLAAATIIAVQAVHEILTPHRAPEAYTLAVLLGVVAVKEAMYRYETIVARRIGSTAVAIDAWHHRSDALTSAAAAIGISVSLVGGPGYEAADDWAALAACGVIVGNVVRFARTALEELMDTSPATTLAESIHVTAKGIDGARFIEKILVRKVGPRYYIDLHLEVEPTMTVRKGHEIAHALKDAVIAQWPEVADILVHVEPVSAHSPSAH